MRAIDADAFKDYCKTGLDETKTMIRSGSMRAFAEELTSAFIRDIDEQPTVEPEQRTGKWIPQDHNKRVGNISTCVYYYPTCSECGQVGNETYKYCPHCGARMNGGEQNGKKE